jgi:predicted MPP superfamily phosphohydrolase
MIVLLGFIISIFCIWQNNDIIISEYVYETAKMSDAMEGFKIAQVSDLHNKVFGKDHKILLNKLKNEKPNIIVITGDLVDSKKTNVDAALEFVKGAIEIAPVYYVTGNHEFWLSSNDWDKLMQGMEQYGVVILDNKVSNIEFNNEFGFYLIGLSDSNLLDNTLKSLCSDIDSDRLQILLAHEPQNINHYSEAKVDLVLSGHAHGGQMRLPLIGGLVAPDQGLFPKYTSGTYIDKNTTMIVSRGLGNSIIPVRIFNRPEIVIITLHKPN